jgi:hypothetical protein
LLELDELDMQAREFPLVVFTFQLAVGLEITALLIGHWLPPRIGCMPQNSSSAFAASPGYSTLKVSSGKYRYWSMLSFPL